MYESGNYMITEIWEISIEPVIVGEASLKK